MSSVLKKADKLNLSLSLSVPGANRLRNAPHFTQSGELTDLCFAFVTTYDR